jgi:hypothetical protein
LRKKKREKYRDQTVAPRRLAAQRALSPFQQIDDQDDYCHDQQNVNQAAGNMKAEAEQPQDYKDYENCPQHIFPFLRIAGPEE